MATAELTLQALEERINALEARNAFQDDIIEQLNDEITVHQASIAELKNNMTIIAARIKEGASTTNSDTPDIEPPPPHY